MLAVSLVAMSQERETIYACEGGVAVYNGRNYTVGTYTVKRSGLPDLTLVVLSAKRYTITQKDTIYKGETFMYKGKLRTFNTIGTTEWNDTLSTIRQCDSLIRHSLTVIPRPVTYSAFDAHICAGDSVKVAGRWYKSNGSNSVTLRGSNHLGGDSVITFRIYVHEPVVVTDYLTIKQGTSKQWYFHRLSTLQPGTHYLTSADLLKTAYGCDSMEVLYVTVLPRTYGTENLSLCEGESADYHGQTFAKTGTYEVLLANRQGGDSVVTLHVQVHPSYKVQKAVTLGYDEPVCLCDTTYRELEPGQYAFRRLCRSRYGCDSLVSLDVTVQKAAQQIVWTAPFDTLSTGHTYTLNATASSSLPVTYTLSTNGKAELTPDGRLQTLAPGYASVTATQNGNDHYLSAKPVERRFVIIRYTDLQDAQQLSPQPRKIMRNGRLYIHSGNKTYNAAGIPDTQ